MNPELLRNLRLEFSLQRLLALPVVLAVVFALVWFSDWTQHPATRLYIAAVVMLYAIILLWGVRKIGGFACQGAVERYLGCATDLGHVGWRVAHRKAARRRFLSALRSAPLSMCCASGELSRRLQSGLRTLGFRAASAGAIASRVALGTCDGHRLLRRHGADDSAHGAEQGCL